MGKHGVHFKTAVEEQRDDSELLLSQGNYGWKCDVQL